MRWYLAQLFCQSRQLNLSRWFKWTAWLILADGNMGAVKLKLMCTCIHSVGCFCNLGRKCRPWPVVHLLTIRLWRSFSYRLAWQHAWISTLYLIDSGWIWLQSMSPIGTGNATFKRAFTDSSLMPSLHIYAISVFQNKEIWYLNYINRPAIRWRELCERHEYR